MKRLIKRFIFIFFAVFTAFAVNDRVYAAELTASEEISSQVDEMLEDYSIDYSISDMTELSPGDLISAVGEALSSRIQAPFRLLGIIMVIIVFSAFMKSSGETAFPESSLANIYNLVCTVSAVAVISPPLLEAYENAAAAIDRGGGFMLVFVPVFSGIIMISGGITSAGLYNAVTIAASELVMQLSAESFIGLFSEHAEVVRLGTQYMHGYVWDCILAGIHFCFSGYFCAYGLSQFSFLHNSVSIICARIPLAYLASKRFPDTLFPMGLATATGSCVSVVICICVYIWMQRKVLRNN